jgi:hypothetical protein
MLMGLRYTHSLLLGDDAFLVEQIDDYGSSYLIMLLYGMSHISSCMMVLAPKDWILLVWDEKWWTVLVPSFLFVVALDV